MVGFDKAKLKQARGISAGYAVETVVAIGTQGYRSVLPAEPQAHETPNGRLVLTTLAGDGQFGFSE